MTEPEPLQMVGDNEVRWRNRTLIYFSGCDYFRLSRHPAVISAVGTALEKSGLNVAASRLTTGNHKIYALLEKELAAFFGSGQRATTGEAECLLRPQLLHRREFHVPHRGRGRTVP